MVYAGAGAGYLLLNEDYRVPLLGVAAAVFWQVSKTMAISGRLSYSTPLLAMGDVGILSIVATFGAAL